MKNSYLLMLAGGLSFCAAIFQVVIGFVPEWSAALGSGEALASNPPLLLISSLMVGLLLVIFGLYGLSGAGLIRRLPWLRLGLFAPGLAYGTVGIGFIFQVPVMLGILPSAEPMPIYTLLVSFGALVASLAYLVGLAVNWKRLSMKIPSKDTEKIFTNSQETKSQENQNEDELVEDQAAEIITTWNLLNPP